MLDVEFNGLPPTKKQQRISCNIRPNTTESHERMTFFKILLILEDIYRIYKCMKQTVAEI